MRLLAGCAACLVLFSCSSHQPKTFDAESAERSYQQRVDALSLLTAWDMAGKLSMDDGSDGGSGNLNWQVRDAGSHMKFRGALGRGAWQLASGPGYAELQRSDGSLVRSDSVSELVKAETGWHIPVDSLKWWVLGIAAPGTTERLELDQQGRVQVMRQDGWDISFNRYRQFGEVELPGRMDAVHGEYRVKMAVSKWSRVPVTQADDSDG